MASHAHVAFPPPWRALFRAAAGRLYRLGCLALFVTSLAQAVVARSPSFTLELGAHGQGAGSATAATLEVQDLLPFIHQHRSISASGLDLGEGVLAAPPANRAPVVTDTSGQTTSDTAIDLQVSASDADGDPLVYAWGTPSSGSLVSTEPATGRCRFLPAAGFSGTVTIPVTAGDGWALGGGTITVTVVEAAFTVQPAGPLVVQESGTEAVLLIAVNAQPTAPVTLALSSSDTSECTVEPSSLRFEAANWQVPQQVTVRGRDDDLADGDSESLLIIAAAVGSGNFAGIDPPDVTVRCLDDDRAELLVVESEGRTQVTEGGASDHLTVGISIRPEDVITIEIESDSQLVVSPAQFTFTADNWATPRTVQVWGVNDQNANGNRLVPLVITASGSGYEGVQPATVLTTIVDDDIATLFANPTVVLVSETGSTSEIKVSLGARPDTAVTLSASSSLPSEATVSPTSWLVEPDEWAQPVPFVVRGQDDSETDGNTAFIVTISAAGDPAYDDQEPILIAGINLDDDTKTLLLEPDPGFDLSEADTNQATYRARLSQAPSAPVTVRLTADDQVLCDTETLLFTTNNWNQDRSITLTSRDDRVAEGAHVGTIAHTWTSSDSVYNSTASLVLTVPIADDDGAALLVDPISDLVTTEAGGSDQFTVQLASRPLATVDILLRSSDPAQGRVEPSSLRFDPNAWNVPQTVLVIGVDGNAYEDGTVAYQILVGPCISEDDVYLGLIGSSVQVRNEVVDHPPTVDRPADVTVFEDSGPVQVVLSGLSVGQRGEDQTLSLSASTGDPTLINDPAIALVDDFAILTLTSREDAFGSTPITITVSDGAQTTTVAFTLTVLAVNDPPRLVAHTPALLGLRGSAWILPEDADPNQPGQLVIDDAETPTPDLRLRLSVAPGLGQLEFVDVINDQVEILAVGDVWTGADLSAGRIRYVHTAISPATSDAFQFTIEDTDGASTPGTFLITLDPALPTLDLLPATVLHWREGSAPALIAEAGLVNDLDSPQLTGGALTVSLLAARPGDTLSILSDGDAPGQISLDKGALRYGGTVFASLTGDDTQLRAAFTTAQADPAAAQALLRRIAFAHQGRNPGHQIRTIEALISDDARNLSAPARRLIQIDLVNDAPALTHQTVITVAALARSGSVAGTDPDNDPLTYEVLSPPSQGVLSSFDPATGLFVYRPSTRAAGQDAFTVRATDGLLSSATAEVSIAITGPASPQRPWLYSAPPLQALAGSLHQWTLHVDTSEIPGAHLVYTLLDPRPGLSLVADGAQAALAWDIPSDTSAGDHLIRVLVSDTESETAALRSIALRVASLPGADQ